LLPWAARAIFVGPFFTIFFTKITCFLDKIGNIFSPEYGKSIYYIILLQPSATQSKGLFKKKFAPLAAKSILSVCFSTFWIITAK
jgi:hypothetical protein